MMSPMAFDAAPVMSAPRLLVVAAWVALGFVLLKRRWTRGRRARRDMVSLGGMALQGVAFALAWNDLPIGRPALPVVQATAVLLAFASVWTAARAVQVLGRHWSLAARTLEDHELVTSGAYASVRHPIYSSLLGLLVATTLTFARPLLLLASVPIYLAGTMVRVRREERLLSAAFGDAWTDYAARVPALLPRWR